MAMKFLFGMIVSAIGGIYLTSDEGKKAREALKQKKSIFEPIIKDLLDQSTKLLDDSGKISSDEIKANVVKLAKEARKILLSLDLEKTTETVKEAIRVASKKVREAYNDTPNRSRVTKTKKQTIKKTVKTPTKKQPKKLKKVKTTASKK